MIEIKYSDNYEVANLAGQSVACAREQFKDEFGIPEKATAKLNGKKVRGRFESKTCLCDDDRLTFAKTRARGPFLVGAMLMALAITGGVFAFGWINATQTLNVTAATNDFAAVTSNTSNPVTWTPYGFFKGAISGPKPVFDIDTASSGYDGDLVVTVALGNADELVKCYRVLALQLELVAQSDNATIDINENGADSAEDWVMLTLNNGEVNMFPDGGDGAGAMTVRVKKGFYITHIYQAGNWGSSYEDPQLFCEVAQRG
ncbi:hypothetical protein ACFLUZ_04805 [Chloroflexota bacterium]